jgi:hypothetical protein
VVPKLGVAGGLLQLPVGLVRQVLDLAFETNGLLRFKNGNFVVFSYCNNAKVAIICLQKNKLTVLRGSHQNKVGDISYCDFVGFVDGKDDWVDLVVGTDCPHKESTLNMKRLG